VTSLSLVTKSGVSVLTIDPFLFTILPIHFIDTVASSSGEGAFGCTETAFTAHGVVDGFRFLTSATTDKIGWSHPPRGERCCSNGRAFEGLAGLIGSGPELGKAGWSYATDANGG
jgi:hypothetical protein